MPALRLSQEVFQVSTDFPRPADLAGAASDGFFGLLRGTAVLRWMHCMLDCACLAEWDVAAHVTVIAHCTGHAEAQTEELA